MTPEQIALELQALGPALKDIALSARFREGSKYPGRTPGPLVDVDGLLDWLIADTAVVHEFPDGASSSQSM